MERKFDLLIFDLDGTLIDNRHAIRENANFALRTYGYPEAESSLIDSTIGLPIEECFIRAVPGIGIERAKELAQTYRERYSKTGHLGVTLLQGVPGVLAELRDKGIKLAVATTKINAQVEPLLAKIGLSEYFDLILGRTEGLKIKPDPAMLNHIMKTLKVGKDRSAMIGDTDVDILAGKNAGIFSIAVLTGVKMNITSLAALQKAKPDMTINTLAELPKAVFASKT